MQIYFCIFRDVIYFGTLLLESTANLPIPCIRFWVFVSDVRMHWEIRTRTLQYVLQYGNTRYFTSTCSTIYEKHKNFKSKMHPTFSTTFRYFTLMCSMEQDMFRSASTEHIIFYDVSRNAEGTFRIRPLSHISTSWHITR